LTSNRLQFRVVRGKEYHLAEEKRTQPTGDTRELREGKQALEAGEPKHGVPYFDLKEVTAEKLRRSLEGAKEERKS